MTRPTTGQVARAGAVGAVALGLGVALLQALQGVVGSFNPRWQVTALFALAGICASLLVQRLAARRSEAREHADRRALLRGALRAWPLPRLAEAPADTLGVFPARRGIGDGPYAPRELDGPLATAIADSELIVVVGPPRAGKSRTAREAARATFNDRKARAVVPRGADGLRALLGLDPPLEVGDDGAVLWLDGLERYLEALDAKTLDELAGAGLSVVATIREETWERLVAGDGKEGEAAKALASRARVFELPATLTRSERARAQRLYPGQDLSRGVGPALATAGHESSRPPYRDDPEVAEPRTRPGPAARDALLLGPAALGILALVVIALLALGDEFEKPKPPTIAEQAQQARREGSAGRREVVDAERADFHGSGEPSYFFVFGDAGGVAAAGGRSDELQVFDQHGDELSRDFRFEPRPLGGQEPLLFQLRFIGDVDGDGADELVGGYGTPAIRGELLLPFAIDWDEDAGRYRTVSLAPEPPPLETRGRGADVAGLRAAYAQHLRLTDVEKEGTLAGYRAQDFAVTADPHRLVSAYVSDIRRGGAERRVELRPSIFNRTGGRPRLTPCRLLEAGTVRGSAPSAKARPLHAATLEAWLTASKDRFCVAFG